MFNAIFDFWITTLYNGDATGFFEWLEANGPTFNGFEMTNANYLALLLTLISGIFIVVLCCLFVYKIIKLIGGLIR